jgi:hypothetical protein
MSTRADAEIRCQDADRLMDACFGHPGAEIPEVVSHHLQECDRCAALYDWILEGGVPAGESDALDGRIGQGISKSLRPVRPLPPTGVLAATFVGLFVVMVGGLLAFLGPGGMGQMSGSQLGAVSALLVAVMALLSLSLSWQMTPGRYQRAPVAWIVGAFAVGLVLVTGLMFPWENASEIFSAGWGCTIEGTLVALPTGLVLLLLVSRGTPISYPALGVSVGATSSLFSLTVLQFVCRHQQAGHLMVWHGGVVVICVAVGYLLGRIVEQLLARRVRRFE